MRPGRWVEDDGQQVTSGQSALDARLTVRCPDIGWGDLL